MPSVNSKLDLCSFDVVSPIDIPAMDAHVATHLTDSPLSSHAAEDYVKSLKELGVDAPSPDPEVARQEQEQEPEKEKERQGKRDEKMRSYEDMTEGEFEAHVYKVLTEAANNKRKRKKPRFASSSFSSKNYVRPRRP